MDSVFDEGFTGLRLEYLITFNGITQQLPLSLFKNRCFIDDWRFGSIRSKNLLIHKLRSKRIDLQSTHVHHTPHHVAETSLLGNHCNIILPDHWLVLLIVEVEVGVDA